MSDKSLLPQIKLNFTQILTQLASGQLLAIDNRRRGGLILCKIHHAEFAGPGSAVGGICDLSCSRFLTVGDLSLVHPESYQDRQKAYTVRKKWFYFTQKAMQSSIPLQRANAILSMLEKYFGPETISSIPDEIVSQLVGVLPKTVTLVRQYRAKQLPQQQDAKVVSV